MVRVRKRPVEVEAAHFVDNESVARVRELGCDPDEIYDSGEITALIIETLEGSMAANRGDWIIKGVQGEFYPVKPDIFDATYELVE
jgi:hypothetical protein